MKSDEGNILILIPSIASIGGAETLFGNLSALLSEHWKVVQVSFDPPKSVNRPSDDIPFYTLGLKNFKIPSIFRWAEVILMVIRLRKLKKKLNIDTTVSMIWKADFISVLSSGSDRKISLFVINLCNNPVNKTMVTFKVFFGMVYRRFDRVLAISNSIKNELKEFFNIKTEHIGTFQNFLPEPNPKQIKVWNKDKIQRYIFCGRVALEKNLDGLIHVWARLSFCNKGAQLIVLGDGPLIVAVKQTAYELGLNIDTNPMNSQASVLFLGTVKRPEDYISQGYIFLLPSRNEGTPTVLILALMLGVPIIAANTNSGGVQDMVTDFNFCPSECGNEIVAGMLLPIPEIFIPETITIWVKALEGINKNRKKREQWSIGAKNLGKKFSYEKSLCAWKKELNNLL